VHERCKNIVKNDAIRATTQARAKDPDSFAQKARRYLKDDIGKTLDSVEKIMCRFGDLAGVRVATYVEEDRERVIEAIKANFSGDGPGAVVEKKDKRDQGKFYRATHCQVAIKEDELLGDYANLKGLTCEVQVCSLLAHVFNEI
jgi:ppGpp synthetase/RelA/SpoT-type nucleotidyltranferase